MDNLQVVLQCGYQEILYKLRTVKSISPKGKHFKKENIFKNVFQVSWLKLLKKYYFPWLEKYVCVSSRRVCSARYYSSFFLLPVAKMAPGQTMRYSADSTAINT